MPPKHTATHGNLAVDWLGAPESTDILSAAQGYVARNWSVIPANGDLSPERPKSPPFSWTEYQHRLPTENELYSWFATGKYSALAIVLGRISGICVQEFDDLAKQAAFIEQFPHLTETRQHRSGHRRGLHFFYQLAPDLLSVSPSNIAGVGEFRANGQYVIAYPSVIDSGMWELAKDAPLYTLTKHDHAAILQFLGIETSSNQLPEVTPPPVIILPKTASADDLAATYRDFRKSHARNDSAYRAALTGRKTRTAEDVIAALATVFIPDPAPPGHRPQSERARYNELAATVYSAYSAAYDTATGQYQPRRQGLSNSAREYLLQGKSDLKKQGVSAARVLETLYITGLQPGQRFSERAAINCCKSIGIGNKTVMTVLDWLEGVERVLDRLRPCASDASALRTSSANSGNLVSDCTIYTWQHTEPCSVWSATGHEIKRGRPSRLFTMPDPAELCTVFGVDVTPGDHLELTDLKSAKAYRVGLKRAYTARNENKEMSRKWEAERLGINVSTSYRYDHAAGVEAIPNSHSTPINWQNVGVVPIEPPKEANGKPKFNYYLRVNGENRPPRRHIALEALKVGQTVEYVQRRANKYRLRKDSDPLLEHLQSLGGVLKS
jgi:hypothetical protein